MREAGARDGTGTGPGCTEEELLEPRWTRSVFPAVLLQHVRQFNDELALFVLLRHFEGVLVLPAEGRVAALAENVCDSMQSGQQDALLRRTTGHVHDGVEQVRPTLAALEGLGDQLVVRRQVRATVDAAVGAVAVLIRRQQTSA